MIVAARCVLATMDRPWDPTLPEMFGMPNFNLSFDMRAPDFGAPAAQLYAEALQMVEYGDSHGIDYVTVMEHHGAKDGYCPTPFVMGAAVAARSKKMRI